MIGNLQHAKERRGFDDRLRTMAHDMEVCSRRRLQEILTEADREYPKAEALSRIGVFTTADVEVIKGKIAELKAQGEKMLAELG